MTFPEQIGVFEKAGKLCFRVRVQPRAGRNAVLGLYDGAVKISLTAPPLDDRANLQLQQFLAHVLRLRKDQICILSGLRSRTKTVGTTGLSRSELLERIAQYMV